MKHEINYIRSEIFPSKEECMKDGYSYKDVYTRDSYVVYKDKTIGKLEDCETDI